MFNLDLEKAGEWEIKFPTSIGSSKKQGDSRKSIYFYFTDYAKAGLWIALAVWITTNCGKFLKRWEYQTSWPASWEIFMQAKKQQLMEQQIGSTLGKEHIKAVYCHLAYLIYIQSISCEILDWMKHKLESTLQGEVSITSDMMQPQMQMTLPLWQKVKKN